MTTTNAATFALHSKSRRTTDPLVAAFQTIQSSAKTSCTRIEQLLVTADGKAKEFLLAAREIHVGFADVTREAAAAVERAEALVHSNTK